MEKKQLDVGLLYAGGLCLEPLSMLTSPILSAEADLVSYMILQVYPSINQSIFSHLSRPHLQSYSLCWHCVS